jgi:hypothetical protein
MHPKFWALFLFICFWVARAIFQLSGDCHHYRLCLALTAFSSEGSFTCHTYCDKGPPFLRSYQKDPWFYLLNAVLLAKKQSLPILNVIGLTQPARAGLELTTYHLLSKSTTTRLRQLVSEHCITHLFALIVYKMFPFSCFILCIMEYNFAW